MIGVLIASHGDLSKGVLNSAEMIVGSHKEVSTLSLCELGVEHFNESLTQKIDDYSENYDEIIILVDITNATPYNCCYRYALSHPECHIYLISGFNLSMVIELLVYKDCGDPAEQIVRQILTTGKDSIEQTTIDYSGLCDDTETDF